MSAEKKRIRQAEELERRAVFNIATADFMENLGPFSAEPSFTQELRDRARAWQEQATRLRDPLKRHGAA